PRLLQHAAQGEADGPPRARVAGGDDGAAGSPRDADRAGGIRGGDPVGRRHAVRAVPGVGLPAPRGRGRGIHGLRPAAPVGDRGRGRFSPRVAHVHDARRGAPRDRTAEDPAPCASPQRVLRRPDLRRADRAPALRPLGLPGPRRRPRRPRRGGERPRPRGGRVGAASPAHPDRLRRQLCADDAPGRRGSDRLPARSMTPGLLTAVTFLPALGGLGLALVPRRRSDLARVVALAVAVAVLALAVPLYLAFDGSRADPQFEERAAWMPTLGVSYHIGVDGISLLLVLLTAFLSPLALASAWRAVEERTKEVGIAMLILETGMIGVFVSLDLFLFYVFWEAMLIPMYFVIGVWGGPDRIYAAIKFVLYTLAGSLLMLVAIL